MCSTAACVCSVTYITSLPAAATPDSIPEYAFSTTWFVELQHPPDDGLVDGLGCVFMITFRLVDARDEVFFYVHTQSLLHSLLDYVGFLFL